MIAVIKGCGHNLNSIVVSLQRLGCDFTLTRDAQCIKHADKVILPGVGAAGQAMKNLTKFGLVELLRGLQQPFLGICLGMQLLYDSSEEDHTTCLRILPGVIRKFNNEAHNPIPHMGWNKIFHHNHSLFSRFPDEQYFYFVHSYYATISDYTIATTFYSVDFSAVVKKDNFIGVQFHPEKSSLAGLKLLKMFLEGKA